MSSQTFPTDNLLNSPAISNSPQSSPVIASELQRPPVLEGQREEILQRTTGDSTGCPTPNDVAGSSITSTESSTLGVVIAAKKAFDMENNYLVNARHHGFITQQIQVCNYVITGHLWRKMIANDIHYLLNEKEKRFGF